MRLEQRSAWRRLAAAILLGLLALGMACGPATAQDGPSRHGKSMVRSYEMPAELLDQYNEAAARATPEERSAAFAKLPAWTGSEFRTATGGNPHTLVLIMLASATDSDDVTARWQLLWGTVKGEMPPLGEPALKKGEPLQLTLASEPATLEEGRLLEPSLRLDGMRNLRLARVRVEVWSGPGETTWLDWLIDWWKLPLTAALWLGLYVYWRHDRKNDKGDDEEDGGAEVGVEADVDAKAGPAGQPPEK